MQAERRGRQLASGREMGHVDYACVRGAAGIRDVTSWTWAMVAVTKGGENQEGLNHAPPPGAGDATPEPET